jgi:Fe-S cluster biogenesis protein NfuA
VEPPPKEAPARGKAKSKTKAKAKGRGKAPAPVPMIPATVYLYDAEAAKAEGNDGFVAVQREVGKAAPEKNAVWNLFKGPTDEEKAKGLVVNTSGATGFEGFKVEDGVATLRLRGGCSSEGATVTIYDHLHRTLTAFDSVQHVKVAGPGETTTPDGKVDHRPDCLQP